MVGKRWIIANPAPPADLRRFGGIHPVLAQVLINRGYDTPEEAHRFLYAKDFTHNPFDIPDMTKAVGRILQAIDAHEPIVVYGDFDADGVTSTTLLVEALKSLRAKVTPYIPHRMDEGYGLNSPALQKMAKEGVKLVITVDCGIRSVQEVEDGKDVGLDIIITDHHSLGPELPNAFAVINCKIDGYGESMLAGVGVTFKLVQALIMKIREKQKSNSKSNGFDKYHGIPLDKLFDLVAIGTVADLMPLNRLENRVLVRKGLEVLNRAERPGIRALLDVSGINPGDVSALTIGFALGPRINAAGRLADAKIAYNLLASSTMEEAEIWAHKLQALNLERQEKTRTAQEIIRQQLEFQDHNLPLIFASHDGFEPGIVGLVAGRITEEYFKPSVVMELGENESRASCRSIPQFDITSALDQCSDLLIRHGGHALAAGFTVYNENIPTLRERLINMAQHHLHGQVLSPTLDVDTELNIHQLSLDMVDILRLLEPCGNGNPKPVFMCRNVHVAECKTVGKDGKHLKLKISRASQPPLDAIGFGLGDWVNKMPDRVDIAFELEVNEWQNKQTLQANLQDIRPVSQE
jgi:single-stranded-DNA-specific exonuclease